MKPNLPTPEGRALGAEVVRLFETVAPKFYAKHPEARARCATCAFRPNTLPNGCPDTVMDALKCVIERSAVFGCHEEVQMPCAGYVVLSAAGGSPVSVPWSFTDDNEGGADVE